MKRRFFLLILVILTLLNVSAQSNLKSGLLYLNDNQYHHARNFFLGQLKTSPEDVRCYCLLGDSYLGLKLPDSAKLVYQKGLSLDPKSPFPLIGMGKIALLKGDHKGQIDFFEKARRTDRKNPEIYYEIVKGCLGLSKKDTATGQIYLTQGIELDSKYAPLHVAFGDYETVGRRFGNATNAYERAIFFDGSNVLAYRKLGLSHIYSRSYRDAITAFTKSIEVNSDQILVYKNLGDLYYSVGKYAEAEKNYQIYMSKAEINFDDKERYAIILFFNKKFNESARLLEEVLKQNSDESVLLRIRGYIAFETGEYQKGVAYMAKFFKLHDPEKIIVSDYIYYGRLLQKCGNDTFAIENYKKALTRDSAKVEIYEDLAKLYARNRMHIDAASAYKKMIANGADKVNTWFLTGKEYYFEGEVYRTKFDSLSKLLTERKIPFQDSVNIRETKRLYYHYADSAFTMVTILNPRYAGGFIWKGRINSLLDPEALTNIAKESYEKASSILESGDSNKNRRSLIECYKYLGSYYFLNGERFIKTDKKQSDSLRATSINYFRKILKLDPNDAQALDVFRKLKIDLPGSH